MSYHARDGRNANAAIVVSVNPSDFPTSDALGGVAFQREIERRAFQLTGGYRAPCQTVGDFFAGKPSRKHGRVAPTYPIGVQYTSLGSVLPDFVLAHMQIGLRQFGRKIRGFDAPDALLTAPETRTSSPVRMTRLDNRAQPADRRSDSVRRRRGLCRRHYERSGRRYWLCTRNFTNIPSSRRKER